METILANVAVWGLGFALFNLLLTVDRVARDSTMPKATRAAVIIGGAILVAYAAGIGVFALQLLLAGGTGAVPEMSASTG